MGKVEGRVCMILTRSLHREKRHQEEQQGGGLLAVQVGRCGQHGLACYPRPGTRTGQSKLKGRRKRDVLTVGGLGKTQL